MKKSKDSGQAMMEFITLLLAFCICFLGLILIIGITISNVEILNSAKFLADEKAQYTDFGNDGRNVSTWKYTYFSFISQNIPFLAGDNPSDSDFIMDNFSAEFANSQYSNTKNEYKFNDFEKIDIKMQDNFAENISGYAYKTANLLEGKTFKRENDERVITISDPKYFDRQKTYEAIRKILGVELKKLNLEDNHSNTVYMPAMKVIDK